MKKDYTAIGDYAQDLDDLAFVDQFWTERWHNAGLNNAGKRIHHLTKRAEYQIMQPYLAQLPCQAKLLDAGCGLGEWTVLLTQQNFDVIGLDISAPAIEALNTRFPALTFRLGDIRHMDFPTNHFDGLFSWGAFEHFEAGLQPCLTESWRVLKPGGYLFITVPYHNPRHIWRELKQWNSWKTEAKEKTNIHLLTPNPSVRFYQWRFTPPELVNELSINGFQVLKIAPVQYMEGIKRAAMLDFGFKENSSSYKLGISLLRRLLPATWLAHMIMAVAQKPEDDQEVSD